MRSRITFFPVGNGDTTLIEHDAKTILTDVVYRTACDDDNDPAYDFAPDLQDACARGKRDYRLSLFVLTHPDMDHVSGFRDLFYCGDPANYAKRSNQDQHILVEEMWVSSYCVDPACKITDASRPIFKEIRRRKALIGSPAGALDGNRLVVLDTSKATTGSLTSSLSWRLLAPTPQEACIPDTPDDEPPATCNDSSLVIQWTLKAQGANTTMLIAGDSTVEVWDRLWNEYQFTLQCISHHILLAPHHCSRGTMARKQDDESYVYSDAALSALGSFQGRGFVVASSKEILDDDDNPPSYEAKERYLELLSSVDGTDVEDRFLNPDTHLNGEPSPVVFDVSNHGPSLRVAGTSARGKSALGNAATNAPVYGNSK